MFNYRNSQWNNFIESLSDCDEGIKRFYKLNKSLLRKLQLGHPLKDSLSNLIFEANCKSEQHADTMESKFHTPPIVSPLDSVARDTLSRQSSTYCTSLIFFSPGYVHEIIKKLPSHRAPDTSGLSTNVLKHYGCKKISHLY